MSSLHLRSLVCASIFYATAVSGPVAAQTEATDPDCVAFEESRVDIRILRAFIDRHGSTALEILGMSEPPPDRPRATAARSGPDPIMSAIRGPAGPVVAGAEIAGFRLAQQALLGRLIFSGGIAATTGMIVLDNFLFPSTAGGDPMEASAGYIIEDPSLLYSFSDEVACNYIRAFSSIRGVTREMTRELRAKREIAAQQDARWSEALRAEGIDPGALGDGPILNFPIFDSAPAQ